MLKNKINIKKESPYLIMGLPAVIVFVTFFILPLFFTIRYSFYNWTNFSPDITFAGFENYKKIFSDASVFQGIKNSLIYAFFTVLLQNIISLPIAVVLNTKFKGRNFFRALFFCPAVLSTLVVGYLWKYILSASDFGFVNQLLRGIGLQSVNFLGSGKLALGSIIFTQVWQWFGWSMVIYLGNLQSISEDLYEAASIDGANTLRKFWHITIPGLAPAIKINLVTGMISGLKVFDVVLAMTNGGPAHKTDTILLMMFSRFSDGNYGYASAFGIIFLVVSCCFAWFVWKMGKEIGTMKKRTAHQTWLKYIVLVVLGCIVIIPIYYLLVTTFKTPAEATASPMGLPSHFSFSGYKEAFEKMQFPRAFFNTFIITACSVIGIIITSSMLGYVLHRKRELKISKIVFVLILSGMLFPYQMSILGLYKLIRSLGLMNHLASVIFINIACNIPFATFMFRSFVATIPEELEEAAKIDGAGTFRIFWKITFPLLKPIVATVTILNSLTIWNDFMGPLYFLQVREKDVLLQEIYRNIGQFSTDWTSLFQMLVLGALPLLIFYLFMQRYIIGGVMSGSVKG